MSHLINVFIRDDVSVDAHDYPKGTTTAPEGFATMNVAVDGLHVTFHTESLEQLRAVVVRMAEAVGFTIEDDHDEHRSLTAEQDRADDKRIADHETALEYSEPPRGWEP